MPVPSKQEGAEAIGIYDNRTKSAYGGSIWSSGYANNPHILRWWTPEHDELLARQIDEHQWHFYWGIRDKVLAITPPEKVES